MPTLADTLMVKLYLYAMWHNWYGPFLHPFPNDPMMS